jgi:hypothetical protein
MTLADFGPETAQEDRHRGFFGSRDCTGNSIPGFRNAGSAEADFGPFRDRGNIGGPAGLSP